MIYRSPLPGARAIRPESNVIVRFDEIVERSNPPRISVTGSKSGSRPGRSVVSDDDRTLVFLPDRAFEAGERVTVRLERAGAASETFSFDIAARAARETRPRANDFDPVSQALASASSAWMAATEPETLPALFPIQSTIYGPASPGRLFLSNMTFGGSATPYLMILDDGGNPIFYRAMRGGCLDFKLQRTGLLTYYETPGGKFYAMDSSYTVVDSFACGNGYSTDPHELRLLANGHALLMSYDAQDVDMTQYDPAGDPQASVIGLVIQELDRDKNVVFQWRSWDHFEITDATHEDLRASNIDYVHGNAIEVDADGNLLISSRHLDEITKIDRQTGAVVWRWGGKKNEFTLLGDTLWFSHQHAIRRLANGNYLMFDNGNFREPRYSRAVEYQLDESARTARMVWQYRNTPDIYGGAMGNAQRLPSGNTLICWGTGKPNVTEVSPDGSKVMELTLPAGQVTYRAFRRDWLEDEPVPTALQLSAGVPNPARGVTNLFAAVPPASRLAVRVFDVRGREVRDAARPIPEASGYRIRVDLTGRPSGLYFCRVTSELGTQSQRIVHMQ